MTLFAVRINTLLNLKMSDPEYKPDEFFDMRVGVLTKMNSKKRVK